MGRSKIDYAARYDAYWSALDRPVGSNHDIEQTAAQIVMSCGVGSILNVGAGEGALLRSLMRRGVDAVGVDVSPLAVARCNDNLPGRCVVGNVLCLPFADRSFQSVVSVNCLDHVAPEDVPLALREIHRVTQRYAFLKLATSEDQDGHWQLTLEGRAWWEHLCFEAGFRKHPAYYRLNAYASLNWESSHIIVPLERIPEQALQSYPLEALREERDLHMDMLREHGSRSDAHVARYELAAKYVRPGDIVLDAACGLGYGSHVLRSLTKCADVTGIDGSDDGIDYAAKNFAVDDSIRFCVGYLPDFLSQLKDDTVDCIVCFETLEYVAHPLALLAEFHRILTPGGRLIASVPHDWSDETGEDPNPLHLHVYTYPKFVSELSRSFDIEHLIGQTADRVKKLGTCEWMNRPRSFQDLALDGHGEGLEAEWLLSVACKSPLDGSAVPYVDRVFTPEQQAASGNALAFARDYLNPWLVRSLISIGLRTENSQLRQKWAESILKSAPDTSADYGAALCILAYEELASAKRQDGLCRLFDSYVAIRRPANPNVLRWQVSLNHVRGLMALARGQREEARLHFERVVACDVASYSPTLLTKPMDAAYMLGLLHASEGDLERAQSVWLDAFHRLLADLGARFAVGYSQTPPGFELREVAAALAVAGRLVVASAHVETLTRSPSTFYGEVNEDVIARIPWLLSQRDAWERLATTQGAQALALSSKLDEMHASNVWLVSQRDAWERLSNEQGPQIAVLSKQLEELQASNAWLVSQRDAWEQVVSERDESIGKLTASTNDLQAANTWLVSQRDAWEKLSAERDASLEALRVHAEALGVASERHKGDSDTLRQEMEALLSANEQLRAQDVASNQALASHKELVAALQTQLQGTRAVNTALTSEKDVWERLASERESSLATEQRHSQDLDARLATSDARLHKLRSHWAMRLLKRLGLIGGDV